MARLDRLLGFFEKLVITLGLGAATALIFANVVARYFFDTGFTWVLETVEYLFAWVVLIGAAHGFRVGAHLGIDLLVERFPPPVQKRLALLALGCCLLFVGLVWWYSVEYTVRIYQWGDLTLDLQIPQWIPYLAIPVGLGLMFIRLLQVGWSIFTGETLRIHAHEGARLLEDVEDI